MWFDGNTVNNRENESQTLRYSDLRIRVFPSENPKLMSRYNWTERQNRMESLKAITGINKRFFGFINSVDRFPIDLNWDAIGKPVFALELAYASCNEHTMPKTKAQLHFRSMARVWYVHLLSFFVQIKQRELLFANQANTKCTEAALTQLDETQFLSFNWNTWMRTKIGQIIELHNARRISCSE